MFTNHSHPHPAVFINKVDYFVIFVVEIEKILLVTLTLLLLLPLLLFEPFALILLLLAHLPMELPEDIVEVDEPLLGEPSKPCSLMIALPCILIYMTSQLPVEPVRSYCLLLSLSLSNS